MRSQPLGWPPERRAALPASSVDLLQVQPTAAEYRLRLYDHGNFVAVVSNGNAALVRGDLGAKAATPVVEGKAAHFKSIADIDSIDIEIDTREVDEFVNCVRFLHPAFGGINLEDIKAPECFVIEGRLRAAMQRFDSGGQR